jgi:hypothetical protein
MSAQGHEREAQVETHLPKGVTTETAPPMGEGIDKEKFTLAANIAMKYAEDTSGGAQQKYAVFRKWIFDICESFYGVRLTRAFVLVGNVQGGDKWWFEPNGQLFDFFVTGADGLRYLAVVFSYEPKSP